MALATDTAPYDHRALSGAVNRLAARWWWPGLVLTLGLALSLRLHYFFGVQRIDSFQYIDAALGLLRGEAVYSDSYPVAVVQSVRLAVVLPLAGVFGILGADQRTALLWPLACSIGSVAAVAVISRRLYGALTGVLSALVLAVNPLEVLYATQLLPDAVVPFLLLLAVWAYLRAQSGRGLFLVGALMGVAFLARLNAPVVLLFLVPYAWLRGEISRRYLWILPGLAAVVLFGEAVMFANGGVPFFGLTRQFASAAPDGVLPWTARIDLAFARMLVLGPYFWPWTAAFALGLIALAIIRPPGWWIGPLWFGSFYLYSELLSQVPIVTLPEKGDRFLTVLGAPIAMTVGAALGARRVTLLGLCLLPILAYVGLAQVPAEKARFDRARGQTMRLMARAIGELPRGPVYFVNNDWRAWVNLYLGYAAESLSPGGPPRAARLRNGQVARLERVALDQPPLARDVRDAFLVHDPGVMIHRPLEWWYIGPAGPNFAIWQAPAVIDPSRWVIHLEPELFDGVEPGLPEDVAGWGSQGRAFHSRGRSAATRTAGARIGRHIPTVPAGDYIIRLVVWNSSGGENRVRIDLNDQRVDAVWSGPGETTRRLELPVTTGRAGERLGLEALAIGQPFLVIDVLEIETLNRR